MMDQQYQLPQWWCSPDGTVSMHAEIFEAWSKAYPDRAVGWQPLYTREQVDAMIAQRRASEG